MKRAYTMSQWERDFARAFAAGVPLESMSTQARGPLLAAAQDEDQPYDEELARARDRAYESHKQSECKSFGQLSADKASDYERDMRSQGWKP